MLNQPILALTTGDPSGIGPEIILKALSDHEIRNLCRPVVVGDLGVMIRAAQDLGMMDCAQKIMPLTAMNALAECPAEIPVFQAGEISSKDFVYGKVSAEYGRAAGLSIEKAIQLALAGEVDAVVTPPIEKKAFQAAGYPYPGHTEMFQALTKSGPVSLMLMKDHFRVVHVSLHMPLKDVVQEITQPKVAAAIRNAHEGCLELGLKQPRIGVCGLNPHAGEGGLFGDEEIRHILPAIEAMRAVGLRVEGPFSADTIFAMLKGKKFDIVVCMYHDQGGIPMKLLSFEWDETRSGWGDIHGVNVTLGLPIIRTSVAHGTGFEIAGKSMASPNSLKDAMHVACNMIRVKNEKNIST